ILDCIHNNLGKTDKTMIYEEVKKIDPDVPKYPTFLIFIKNIEKEKQKRAMRIFAEMKSVDNLTDDQLMKTALQGILGLGDVVVKQTVEDAKELLERGKPLPADMKKQIMEWFFKGTDAHNKSKMIKIQSDRGTLLETIVDNLMVAAQYGKLKNKDEIIEGEYEEEEMKHELLTETKKVYA
ncbi:MAG: hypothetical protein KAI72_00475, partial [Candidatus Pacebacteria bacterium]|nr:hypothetical protein [Candidatus Paceibacterota bacterium]